MVERFIAPVLKTGDPKGSVGSNPTPSAINFTTKTRRTQRKAIKSSAPKIVCLCVLRAFVVKISLSLAYRPWQGDPRFGETLSVTLDDDAASYPGQFSGCPK
jgi:hypothetical protein